MRILLIDDDAECRTAVRRMLEELGHCVSEASDGEAGLQALCQERADLLLCDLFLPGMNGLKTIHRVHRDFPSVRVVAISWGAADVLLLANLFGAEELLAKPVTMTTLQRALRKTSAA